MKFSSKPRPLPKRRRQWLRWPWRREGDGMAGAPSTMWADSRQVEWGLVGKHNAPLRWSLAGLGLGLVLCLIAFAPASWLASALDDATEGHLLLADTRGSIWSGSAVLILTGGRGSRDSSALPGRLEWNAGLAGSAFALRLRQACCLNGDVAMLLKPGFGSLALSVQGVANASAPNAPNVPGNDWLARVPASWLGGLGTPWNTLQLGGSVRLSSKDLKVERVQGRWRQTGQLDLDFVNLSSRVSTVAPLGSYRFSVIGDGAGSGVSRLQLSTLGGSLLLNGDGTFGGGKVHFRGDAQAAPGDETALNNLLNIIGRRQGARSVISIG